jgi:hypothetical protein
LVKRKGAFEGYLNSKRQVRSRKKDRWGREER